MTSITLHQGLILYSGCAFMASGLLNLVVWQLLGPRYVDHWTLGPKRRTVIFAVAVGCFIRGVTLVFPGSEVITATVSNVIPFWATSVLAVSVMVAELLSGQRLPPPVMARVMSVFAASRPTRGVDALMGARPAETYLGERLSPDPHAVRFCGAKLRIMTIGACLLGLLIVLGVVLHAAAATLPTH